MLHENGDISCLRPMLAQVNLGIPGASETMGIKDDGSRFLLGWEIDLDRNSAIPFRVNRIQEDRFGCGSRRNRRKKETEAEKTGEKFHDSL
jgi:hypothetical protein